MEVGNCFVWDKATSDSKQESSPYFQPESGGQSILSLILVWSNFGLCDFCLCLSGLCRCPTNVGPMWDLLTWDHAASFFGSCISMPPTHATFNFFSPCFLLFLHFLCFVFGNTSFSARRHLAQSHISSHSTRDKALCELSPSQPPRSPPFCLDLWEATGLVCFPGGNLSGRAR